MYYHGSEESPQIGQKKVSNIDDREQQLCETVKFDKTPAFYQNPQFYRSLLLGIGLILGVATIVICPPVAGLVGIAIALHLATALLATSSVLSSVCLMTYGFLSFSQKSNENGDKGNPNTANDRNNDDHPVMF